MTTVGRVLRKLSIGEVPQLFNVLRGEMSMVGPRPALADEVAKWDDEIERLCVLPGLTGMWQVSGQSDSSFETTSTTWIAGCSATTCGSAPGPFGSSSPDAAPRKRPTEPTGGHRQSGDQRMMMLSQCQVWPTGVPSLSGV